MLMAEKGVWLSTQPFVGDDDTVPLNGQSRINQLQVIAGTNTVYPLAKKHKLKQAGSHRRWRACRFAGGQR
jgi:hypothetical protein